MSLFKEISKQLNDLLFGILYYNCCNKFLKECINFEEKIKFVNLNNLNYNLKYLVVIIFMKIELYLSKLIKIICNEIFAKDKNKICYFNTYYNL